MTTHWKKIDHIFFLALLPLAFLIFIHWAFVLVFTSCWVIALAYDLWEHDQRSRWEKP